MKKMIYCLTGLLLGACFRPDFGNVLDPFTTEGIILNHLLLSPTKSEKSSTAQSCPSDPSSLPGLQLWLKADILTQADASIVSNWPDSTANNNTVTAGGNANFYNAIINGKPVVRFNGSTSRLIKTSAVATSTNHTIFILFKRNALGTQQMLFQIAPGGCTGGESGYFMPSNLFRTDKCGDGASILDSTTVFDSLSPQLITITYNGVNKNLYYNGRPDAFLSYATAYTLTNIYLGADSASGNYFSGDYAEIIYYNRTLSDLEISNINSYLSEKYAISISIQC